MPAETKAVWRDPAVEKPEDGKLCFVCTREYDGKPVVQVAQVYRYDLQGKDGSESTYLHWFVFDAGANRVTLVGHVDAWMTLELPTPPNRAAANPHDIGNFNMQLQAAASDAVNTFVQLEHAAAVHDEIVAEMPEPTEEPKK